MTKELLQDKRAVTGQQNCYRTKELSQDKRAVTGQKSCHRTKELSQDKRAVCPVTALFSCDSSFVL
jgi:hypothetical protein